MVSMYFVKDQNRLEQPQSYDAQSYSHQYFLLEDPLQGSLSFFFIGAGIMVYVLCNHLD